MNSSPLSFFASLGGASSPSGSTKGKGAEKTDAFASLLGSCLEPKGEGALASDGAFRKPSAGGEERVASEEGAEESEGSFFPFLSLFSAVLAAPEDFQPSGTSPVISDEREGDPEEAEEKTDLCAAAETAQAGSALLAAASGEPAAEIAGSSDSEPLRGGEIAGAARGDLPGEGSPLLPETSGTSLPVEDALADLLQALLAEIEGGEVSVEDVSASFREFLADREDRGEALKALLDSLSEILSSRDDLKGPVGDALASFREALAQGRDLGTSLDEALLSLGEIFSDEEALSAAASSFRQSLSEGRSFGEALSEALSVFQEISKKEGGPGAASVAVAYGGSERAFRSDEEGDVRRPVAAAPGAGESEEDLISLRPVDGDSEADGDFSRPQDQSGRWDRSASLSAPAPGSGGPEPLLSSTGPAPIRTEGAPSLQAEDLPRRLVTSFPLAEGLAGAAKATLSLSGTRAHVVVEPPSLGRVEIFFRQGAQGMEATFRVDNEGLRQLIQTQLDQLRAALQQTGITLQELSVDVRSGSGQSRGSETEEKARTAIVGDDDGAEFSIDLEQGLLSWMA